jgi:hypothetical protein
MDEQKKTPANWWSKQGDEDPHGDRYAIERAALCLGHLTDDEIANGVFANGGARIDVRRAVNPDYIAPFGWLTGAKDRIRWLSRALTEAETKIADLEAKIHSRTFDEDGRMSKHIREFIEGMSVSVDVSTSEADADHRYYGQISEVMDANDDDKHGVVILVQNNVEANFEVRQSIPDNVYFNPDHDNFYTRDGHKGMGEPFFTEWFSRRGEFPTEGL